MRGVASTVEAITRSCPLEWMAVNRIMDSMGKIRFNETNLLLFPQYRVFFLTVQRKCHKCIKFSKNVQINELHDKI